MVEFWPFASIVSALPLVGFLAIFLWLVAQSVAVNKTIGHLQNLVLVNEQELAFGRHEFKNFYDGSPLGSANHAYAQDLDLFGRSSLFQYLNRSAGYSGRKTLGTWLLQPANKPEIEERQAAAKALAPQVQWRQELQAKGMAKPLSAETAKRLQEFLGEAASPFFSKKIWQALRWIGPFISMVIVALYATDVISNAAFSVAGAVLFLITGYFSKKATPTYIALGKIADEMLTLSESLACIEKLALDTEWLLQRKQALTANGSTASVAIKQLNGILERLEYRLNPLLFVPLNILLYWDLQQMLAFEKWKKDHHPSLIKWLEVLGEIEALSALANCSFNHPNYAFPDFEDSHGQFEATDLGHPLIAAEKRVSSDFGMKGLGKVSIITGSNMAGKSTFLRSVGLALVMGQAGGPVCASRARFSSMLVMSSMRIADNLEESTSTFYAELKKLKTIIEAVDAGLPVFLLLDEILRGTNSGDRHTGSEALVKQLIKKQAVGILATHDLALAAMAEAWPQHIENYHFDVQVAGEELYFDYQLKHGICQSLNASILMKKIGIDMG